MPLIDAEITGEINRIKASNVLPDPPLSPREPSLCSSLPDKQRLYAIQRFVESFEYNYTGKPFLVMKKSRGASHVNTCAKQIIRAALPIQCVEAVFLASYLSSTMYDIDRVPLSFKSKFKDGVHRHIVLAVRLNGKWGSLGISRRANLMNKPIKFDTLFQLVKEFERSYEEVYHRLLTVYIGLPMPQDKIFSDRPIKWRATKIRIYRNDPADVEQMITHFTDNMKLLNDYYILNGSLPDTGVKSNQATNRRRNSNFKSAIYSSDGDSSGLE